jgi:hypothetical protein
MDRKDTPPGGRGGGRFSKVVYREVVYRPWWWWWWQPVPAAASHPRVEGHSLHFFFNAGSEQCISDCAQVQYSAALQYSCTQY